MDKRVSAAQQMEHRREEALQLHLLEEEAMARVRIDRNSSRPKRTNIQYASKQLEFLTWNNEMGYSDEYVTEAKMILLTNAWIV